MLSRVRAKWERVEVVNWECRAGRESVCGCVANARHGWVVAFGWVAGAMGAAVVRGIV